MAKEGEMGMEKKKLDHGEYIGSTEKVEIKLTDRNRDDILQQLVENNPNIVQTVFVIQSFDGGKSAYGCASQWDAGERKDVVEEAQKIAKLNEKKNAKSYENVWQSIREMGPPTFYVHVQKYKKPKE